MDLRSNAIIENELATRCRRLSQAAALFTVLMGITVIFSWIFDIEFLNKTHTSANIKLNAAICFTLVGISLLLFLKNNGKHSNLLTDTLLPLTVILISGTTLAEYALNINIGIDECLLKDHWAESNDFPGRMPAIVSINFLLCGCALLERNYIWLKHTLCLIIFITTFDALFGYAYGNHLLQHISHYSKSSLNSNITFLVVVLGVIFSNPEAGFTRIFVLNSLGGTLARWLLPIVIFIPPILGLIAFKGQQLGFYNDDFLVIIIVSLVILTFSTLVWVTAYSLHIAEKRYQKAANKLKSVHLRNKKLRDTKQHLEIISSQDALTGLANRTCFNNLLEHALARASRYNTLVAVFFMDLDNFKLINDQFGHAVGDKLLIETAKRLKETLRGSDTISRLGGDEFTVILEDPLDITGIEEVAKKIVDALNLPMTINGVEIFISASIGISYCPKDSFQPEILIQKADTAMYQAKKLGKKQYQFYTSSLEPKT